MKSITQYIILFAALLLAPFVRAAVTFTVLHSFSVDERLGVEEGQGVNGLILGTNGNFYGTATSGGSGARWNDGCGTVFRMTPDGTFTTLHSFSGPDGQSPGGTWNPDDNGARAGLVQGADGNFYGGTYAGGIGFDPQSNCYNQSPTGYGTLFRMTPDGALTTLVFFNGTNGSNPSSLFLAADGNFYGTTLEGGGRATARSTLGLGSVFRMTPDGTLTTLAAFDGTNGSTPSSLLQGKDGNFYGTSGVIGDSYRGVFKMTPDGFVTTFATFTDTNVTGPFSLMQASDGNFYGTTHWGGVRSSYNDCNGCYFGTIFKLTVAGTLTTLVRFTGANGGFPVAALVEGTDGNFYGSTYSGGLQGPPGTGIALTGGLGTLFSMTSQGNLTTLFRFRGTNGLTPIAKLVQAGDGSFYGITPYGGTDTNGFIGPGEIFRLTVSGADAPKIISTVQSSGTVTLSWLALRGRSYQLQSTTNLTLTNWTNVGGQITATNTSATSSDFINTDRRRFYRVALLP